MVKKEYNKELIGTILVLLTALISGVSIVVNKFFVTTIDPLIFTAIRAFFIGVIFFGISFFISRVESRKINRAPWKYLLLIGLVGGSFAFWLFFEGIKMTTAGRAAFIHKTLPIYAIILAFIFLKEKITKKQIFVMIAMIVGLLIMELSKISPEVRLGDILVLGATLLWAIENTISKRVMLNKESNWVVTFSRMFFGSLILLAVIVFAGKVDSLLSLNSKQILYITVSGLFLFFYVLTWYWGLKYINLSKASTLLLISPVISLILGFVWLGEEILLLQIIGSLIILVGAGILARTESKNIN